MKKKFVQQGLRFGESWSRLFKTMPCVILLGIV
jgi:hypothetical protein